MWQMCLPVFCMQEACAVRVATGHHTVIQADYVIHPKLAAAVYAVGEQLNKLQWSRRCVTGRWARAVVLLSMLMRRAAGLLTCLTAEQQET